MDAGATREWDLDQAGKGTEHNKRTRIFTSRPRAGDNTDFGK
ncbi:unnamed protein product, partial [marine sediment metagenome]